MTLDDIDITNNLVWRDEFTHNQVEQVSERSLTGGLIIQSGVKLFGRPVTLEGWLPRSAVDALHAVEAIPSRVMQLTLADGRQFSVVFDRSRGIALDARPVFEYTKSSTVPNWQYMTTLRLITVEPESAPETED